MTKNRSNIMGLKNLFKPKANKFIQLLIEQATLTVKGLDLLKVYMQGCDSKISKQIHSTEKEADEIRRILIEDLMKTFVTPFDREDIACLSREVDDVLDYANTTVDEMEILNVIPTTYMQQMASLLYDAAVEIKLAIERLQDKHYSVAGDHAKRAKTIENRVESIYRTSLGNLFKSTKNVKHVVHMLKVREIYRHLSNAADREDDAANVVSDIVMKAS
jgi:predicted phosphate transport protein (TIGR00153 family)